MEFGIPQDQALRALLDAGASAEMVEGFHKAINRNIQVKAEEERKRYVRFPTGNYAGLPEKMTTDEWMAKYGAKA